MTVLTSLLTITVVKMSLPAPHSGPQLLLLRCHPAPSGSALLPRPLTAPSTPPPANLMANTTAPRDFIYKSVDNGRTWVKTTTQPSETGSGLGGTTMEGLFSNTNFTTPSAPATQMSIITESSAPALTAIPSIAPTATTSSRAPTAALPGLPMSTCSTPMLALLPARIL